MLPAPKPRLPTFVRLLPMVALVSGYTAALASTARVDAVASALLLLVFAALVGLGWGAVRYAVASVRHRRWVTEG